MYSMNFQIHNIFDVFDELVDLVVTCYLTCIKNQKICLFLGFPPERGLRGSRMA